MLILHNLRYIKSGFYGHDGQRRHIFYGGKFLGLINTNIIIILWVGVGLGWAVYE